MEDETDHDIEDLFEDFPSMRSVAPFLKVAEKVRWFRSLGERPHAYSVGLARDYADILGFPDADPVFLPEWEDAAYAAENPEINSSAWEAEEQLRASLTDDVLLAIDEDTLNMVMTHIAQTVTPAIDAAAQEAKEFLRIEDDEFVQAAAGAAAQACYQAALVGMANPEDDHPFVKRFQLFEQGHWPIAIIGNSFLIY
ncbi:hypothetical protein [Kordiimonas pumila]|uniref:DUF4303 domain-containing protein n=1 Tax=Kordiimonas pumila TaxID=2161677 RepID=A0ABV7D9Z8_9PROT|nr:hypothetical protein [Kordiimonas pumila]